MASDELLRSVLAKAQRLSSVLACGRDSGQWYWLWSTEGGGIGHEDVDPRLLPFLTDSGAAAGATTPEGCTCGPVPNDGRYDDPDCPHHGATTEAPPAPTALDVLGELIDWFGASDWTGPQLPAELGRRIADVMERRPRP